MMQFLWRYVDELVGKGLSVDVMAQFFFYSAMTLIPASLPLAVLLASLISFGNLGEQFELLAMKAAGVPLIRIMRPLWIFVACICGVSFYFQNVAGPDAEVKLWTLIISLKQKSPELDIPEGVFYTEISDYNIYVKSKDRKTGLMRDMMIYNFSDGFENAHIILADSGRMEVTADKSHLLLHLYNGELFENLKQQTARDKTVPYRRESFKEKHTIISFNSDLKMVDGGFMEKNERSKNVVELQNDIDSMRVLQDSVGRTFYQQAMQGVYRKSTLRLSKTDSVLMAKESLSKYDVDSVYRAMSLLERQKVLNRAVSSVANQNSDFQFKRSTIGDSEKSVRRFNAAWHKKYTLALSCLFFFFIGAPLGAIIRKGGLGMPVVISVLFFIVYYIIDTSGYKMARDGHWIVWSGIWMSSAILAPIGIFLSYKANNDSVMFNVDTYLDWLKLLVGIRSKRHLAMKEVVIVDIDYQETLDRLHAHTKMIEEYREAPHNLKLPNYFRLWFSPGQDSKMEDILTELEDIIVYLSNSRHSLVVKQLNAYPVIPIHAHTRPFAMQWLNTLIGIFVPLGIFFYVRVWLFRIRLCKDIQLITKAHEQLEQIIVDHNLNK